MNNFRTPKALETVVEGFTQRILAGEWAPGARLPTESELQEQWGVSRSVVREAMKILASQGLVSVEQGRGTFVAQDDTAALGRQIEWALRRGGAMPVGASDIWDNLLDVRRVLELAAARRAAQHATESDVAAMRQAIAAMRARPDDSAAHRQSELAFHRALAAATQNPLWVALLASFNDLLARYFDFSYFGADNALFTADEHAEILRAVESGDEDLAAEAMRLHLQSSERDLDEARRQQRVPGGQLK